MSSQQRDLDVAIAHTAAEIAELNGLLDEARNRLSGLRDERNHLVDDRAVLHDEAGAPKERSSQEKVTLFRSLFRGRDDVFPVRWENPRTGRSGYAPKCSNEWIKGVCEKPRVRCGECPNQAFVLPEDDEALAHLQGRQVIGVYPLLRDDTCWLLALDFDGADWQQDVAALLETCHSFDVVTGIERSRSGKGAHVWFFFSSPVTAMSARKLGFLLLTETMAHSPTLGMDSYDRLFPSQDVLPNGGFGNLIALPLQHEARAQGNTLFLDEDFEPHQDQWSCLASLPRIEPERLNQLTQRAESTSRLLGVRGTGSNGQNEKPWRVPRREVDRLAAAAELPTQIRVTYAQQLYVERAELPPVLVDAIRRLAVFSNPTFLERQRLRLSTGKTPRVIVCFEELAQHLVLPRGCHDDLVSLFTGLGISLELVDERADGAALELAFRGDLADAQERAVEALLPHELGVLCAPPGTGKTVMAASLIAARGRSTLVLVHRQPLVDHWVAHLSQLLDQETAEIGILAGGKRSLNGQLDVATVQSLARNKEREELLAAYGQVVVDECHHVPAVSTEHVLRSAPARYVLGLTATPYRRDGHQPIITMQCGPIRHSMGSVNHRGDHKFKLHVIRRDTAFSAATPPTEATVQEIYSALATDEQRLELVANDVEKLMREGRSPIVLTERREHLERIEQRLNDMNGISTSPIILHGEMKTRARRAALERLEAAADAQHLVLATGRYIGEGFDDPRLDTLLLAMPIAWKGTVTQYVGRLHRPYPGKNEVTIYDYVDSDISVLRRMFAKRLKTYRSLGYVLDEPQLALAGRDELQPA